MRRTKCSSLSSQSSSSSSLSSSEIWEFTSETHPDLVKLLILNKNCDRVCMIKVGDLWDIPTFEYADSISNGHNIAKCYKDLKEWLGEAWGPLPFWFTKELLGEYGLHHTSGFVRLKMFFVEFPETVDPAHLQLPDGAIWKDTVELEQLRETKKVHFRVAKEVQNCMLSMQRNKTIRSNLNDTRSTVGWHSKASDFLKRTAFTDGAEVAGRVVQHQLTSTSTILTVETSRGRYFLKAPSNGCNEVQITTQVGSLFPGFVPPVLASSHLLNCFVTREFDQALPKVQDLRHVLRTVAHIHHSSKEHVELLAKSGCPVRDVNGLVAKMESWISGDGILTVLEDNSFEVEAGRRHLKALLPFVKKLGEGIRDSNIPMTLVHGDLDITNLTRDPQDNEADDVTFRLFDWQYAYIGHPFCDFHRMHEYLPEQCIDDYLRTWSANEGKDRARALFERCWILGRFFKLMSLAEWFESNNTQLKPSLRNVMLRLIEVFYNSWAVRKNPFNGSERRSL